MEKTAFMLAHQQTDKSLKKYIGETDFSEFDEFAREVKLVNSDGDWIRH